MMLGRLKGFVKCLLMYLHRYSLLIKELDIDKDGASSAVIQVIGKPVFFSRKVKDIVRDDQLLRQFPPEQIKTLVILACNEKSSLPEYKISAIDFEMDEFIVKEIATGMFFSLSMSEINQPYLLNNFSKEDIFKIGVRYSEYQTRSDDDQIKHAKQPKLCIVQNL